MGRDFRSVSDLGLVPCSDSGFCEVDFTMTVLFLLPPAVLFQGRGWKIGGQEIV